jgi:PKD repeat protein
VKLWDLIVTAFNTIRHSGGKRLAPKAAFAATPLSGTAPLTVQFTDQSSNGPTAWAWDFTGDGVTDSTVKSPSHTYDTPGVYTVTLTALNSYGSGSVTKPSYITVSSAAAPAPAPAPPPPPTVVFSGFPLSGVAPLSVAFTDASSGSPTSWAWDFTGDGVTDSTQQNPTATYATPGDYTVGLSATSANGTGSLVKPAYVHVTAPPPPTAAFVGTPLSGTVPFAVQFTDQSSGSPTSWLWSFGDGSTSNVRNPSHTYNAAGTYNVTLTATNLGGSNSITKTAYITGAAPPAPPPPPPPAPVAAFVGTPLSGTTPFAAQFTDQSSNTPTSWAWTFGDGATSTAQNPSHTYSAAGTYSVSLTAKNAGGSNTLTKTAYIAASAPLPPAPVAAFTASPTSGTAPLTVQFTDQSSGSPTSWLWSFGDGTTSTAQNPSHSYNAVGTYTVTLTATNAGGSSNVTKTSYIAAAAPAPAPTAAFTASPTSGTAPLAVQFSDQSTGTPTSWLWNFGDGSTSTVKNPAHTYAAAGTYTVTLTATNAQGSNTLTKTAFISAGSSILPLLAIPFPLSLAVSNSNGTQFPSPYNGATLTAADGQVRLGLVADPGGSGQTVQLHRVRQGDFVISGGVRSEELAIDLPAYRLDPGPLVDHWYAFAVRGKSGEWPLVGTVTDDSFAVFQTHTPLNGSTQPPVSLVMWPQAKILRWRYSYQSAAPVGGVTTTQFTGDLYNPYPTQNLPAPDQWLRYIVHQRMGWTTAQNPITEIWQSINGGPWVQIVNSAVFNSYNDGGVATQAPYLRIGTYKWSYNDWSVSPIAQYMTPIFYGRGANLLENAKASLAPFVG